MKLQARKIVFVSIVHDMSERLTLFQIWRRKNKHGAIVYGNILNEHTPICRGVGSFLEEIVSICWA